MATQRIFRGTTTFGAASAGDTFYITEGGYDITGNVDYSGVNTSVLAEVSKGYSGSIGTSADPWQTAFSSMLWYAGSGHLYFESDAADTETTPLVHCVGGGHFHFMNAGIVTRLECIAGVQTVSNGAVVTTGRFGGRSTAYLLDTGTATALTTIDVVGAAHVYSQRPHTTINIGQSGTLTIDADSAGGVNAHTTASLWGGNLIVRDSGTITTLNAYMSIPDLSSFTGTLTVTNTNINMMLPGAQAFLDHPRVTFTNTPTRLYTDGRPL